MYEDELTEYEHDAEDRYDDYFEEDEDGYFEEDEFDQGFHGNEDAYYGDDFEEEVEYVPGMGDFDYGDDYYDSYKKTSIGKIDPNDRTLTITVTNTSGADEEAIIFGGNQNAAQVAGVTVTVAESSHAEVREESKAHPFRIRGLKMRVSDALQFDNVVRVIKRTATGSDTTRVYQPRNATSPQNLNELLIDDSNFGMDVTGQTSMRFIIRDGVTVVFTLTIKARANMGNLLRGNNVAELSRAPRTTGLPQIDLLRKRKTAAFGLQPSRPKRIVKKIVRRVPSRRRSAPPGYLRRRRG